MDYYKKGMNAQMMRMWEFVSRFEFAEFFENTLAFETFDIPKGSDLAATFFAEELNRDRDTVFIIQRWMRDRNG